MSTTTQSITELSSTMHVKDTISFTLNCQFLNQNFLIVKQCLQKIQELDNQFKHSIDNQKEVGKKVSQIQKGLQKNSEDIEANHILIKSLQNNVGDQFMKKMYAIEEKTKNMFAFEDTVKKLEDLNLFVTNDKFNQIQEKNQQEINKALKIKEELSRYLQNSTFELFKASNSKEINEKQEKIEDLKKQILRLEGLLKKTQDSAMNACKEVTENSLMIKEINFPQMQDKIKKFKDDIELRVGELGIKMKKKVGVTQLTGLEQNMIDKLDKFLLENQKGKADRQETKEALLFLQKKILQIEEIFAQKTSEDDKDALFSTKKWQCASCTKDLGKFQGKLGQFRPWAVFPCKELDPEKTGGYGYLNYIDKMAYKKGDSFDDNSLERMNKTFNVQKEKHHDASPKKMNTTRATNVISNYGSDEKSGVSLKDAYFRENKTEKGDRANKLFRVKKDSVKGIIEEKQKAKDI